MCSSRTAPLSLLLTATLLMFVVAVSGRSMIELNPTVTVNIENDFPVETGTVVTAHCNSSETDFGDRGIGPTVVFPFSFKPNILGSTRFKCYLTRSDSLGGSVVFDAYWYGRDADERCTTQCQWNVDAIGVHGIDQATKTEDLIFPWLS